MRLSNCGRPLVTQPAGYAPGGASASSATRRSYSASAPCSAARAVADLAPYRVEASGALAQPLGLDAQLSAQVRGGVMDPGRHSLRRSVRPCGCVGQEVGDLAQQPHPGVQRAVDVAEAQCVQRPLVRRPRDCLGGYRAAFGQDYRAQLDAGHHPSGALASHTTRHSCPYRRCSTFRRPSCSSGSSSSTSNAGSVIPLPRSLRRPMRLRHSAVRRVRGSDHSHPNVSGQRKRERGDGVGDGHRREPSRPAATVVSVPRDADPGELTRCSNPLPHRRGAGAPGRRRLWPATCSGRAGSGDAAGRRSRRTTPLRTRARSSTPEPAVRLPRRSGTPGSGRHRPTRRCPVPTGWSCRRPARAASP
jgi:hypothetical protein